MSSDTKTDNPSAFHFNDGVAVPAGIASLVRSDVTVHAIWNQHVQGAISRERFYEECVIWLADQKRRVIESVASGSIWKIDGELKRYAMLTARKEPSDA